MTTTFDAARFALLDGEKILKEGRPIPFARPAWIFGSLAGTLCSVIGIPFLPAAYWVADRQFQWHRWWVTNRRIIVQNGIIGYQVRSIPLYRVTDVSVQCSWYDQLFGLTHVTVRDMTGEVAHQGISTGVTLLAVPDAPGLRDAILEQVDAAGSGRTEDSQIGRVVELLEQVVNAKAA